MDLIEEVWDRTKALLVHFAHFEKRNRIRRYGLPIILVVIVFFIKQYFHQLLGDNSAFLMVSFIVAVSSVYGGLGPGLFATILSAGILYFNFLIADFPHHPFIDDFIVLAIFIVEGFVISVASEARFQIENQKDEFIGFLAHELKNPLASVKGFSELIVRNAKSKGYEKILLYSEQINIQSDRILELINDLLDITKIEIGKFTYVDSSFDVNSLVNEVITHQRAVAKNRSIELRGSSKKIVYGDRYRIGQVITNLLTNAIKYSPETKKIIVRVKDEKGAVCISVRDYGLGIEKKDQQKIFSRFYRTDVIQRSRSEGLGLGLYICRQIVDHHKGKMWVESKEGKGSIFYVKLPVGMPVQRKIR